MAQLSEKDLFNLNRQGIVPGPNESEEDFLKRADYCLGLRSHLEKELGKDLPFPATSESAADAFPVALATARSFYDISPGWLPVYFSDHKLTLWHGGCAWIFQEKEGAPKGALMQVRQQFRRAETYLGIYSKQELAVHEFAHVGRMCFEEPKFEELLAYRSSKSWFRRWFGPIIKSPLESIIFVIVLVMTVLMDLSLVTMGYEEFYRFAMWFKLIPLMMIAAALCRLWLRHRQFNRCREKLAEFFTHPDGVIYRLTDREIIDFNNMRLEEIREYVGKQTSLRWKVIKGQGPLSPFVL